MFGKLTLDAVPYHEPIIVVTVAAIIIGGLALLAAITYFGKWSYLWNEWLTSVDHKRLGIMYVIVAIVMLLRGFADAIMMRSQQVLASAGEAGFLPPHHYDQIFTAHGVIMIFFVAMPFVIGLMNLVVPLQLGARDVAFPFLNNLSFWFTVVGVILVNLSLGVGEFAQTGWLAYPPLSGIEYSPGVGVDYWIWALQLSGIGTTLTGINFFVTIIKMRAPGMTMFKMPVFTWASLCANILIIASFPILTVTIALLTLDRYLGTHFFTNDMGGNITPTRLTARRSRSITVWPGCGWWKMRSASRCRSRTTTAWMISRSLFRISAWITLARRSTASRGAVALLAIRCW